MKKESYNPEKFTYLYSIEENSFWFNSRNKIIIFLLKRYYPEMKSLMEIGCGTGFVLKGIRNEFPNCKLKGTELFREGLVHANKRLPDVEFEQLDAINLNDKEEYDCIGAFDVLEHIEADDAVLKNLFEACKKGIIITVPQHKFMWSKTDVEACHVRRYSNKEIKTKLVEAGFQLQYINSFVSLLFPLMLISRIINKSGNSELNISKSLNFFFTIIMNIEILMIKNGIKFPFGGSLIIVAKK